MTRRTGIATVAAVVLLGGYYLLGRDHDAVPASSEGALDAGGQTADLGPADGRELPGQDTGRVAVGAAAPDFSLLAYSGDVVTLSDFRRQKNVILAFYRGHW